MTTALALTQGDPAGIGPEITLRAWLAREEHGLAPFFVIGDPEFLGSIAARLGFAVPLVAVEPEEAAAAFARALPVVRLPGGLTVAAEPGQPDPASAAGTLASIDEAVRLVQAGRAPALVTNPIAKHVLYEAGFRHPGHTEYLAALAAAPGAAPPTAVMLLWSEDLAVVPVTIHVALRRVPDLLTADLVVETARIVDRDLRSRFGLAAPRLVLAGLNPHAGEAGTMGTEDRDVLAPAVERLRAEGIAITGPHPADTLFHARARATYDVALAPTHDQALIPIKTLAFDEGVNVTLGLPFLRTSPDHGTAFDIAGKGLAMPDSLIAALKLAGRLTRAQDGVAA
ncbi:MULTISPECIES: 4-hydroxythreonine-4-phosphate dehydrogenase PdxA [Methylobacterium]|uniref:4-hydroxythreonine-4-phosphate dehydrogenase PdxA n=1 Tax=Methylobacterium TaxID=407 RepID=UPI000B817F2A|nr:MULTISPECIES: 4-hydroxythreonine-4-phosphate dehydrogenase PdxA [Methylobacterium]MBK3397878.1 4-hydroxythreonine-4-phosphate dehydrogenase PdxA [Methylobacterium ajmalii]MBK3408768.1 4-hydroxythreonine-4-phosphate dehydrogenase PdxA [Methylobacterium ajmalii]MBK3423874.1 4-hydroxythreonine-4-phosphate dehydrogenase PdxA [Methylobacterium ajmalii]MBZ6413391.1 4-hydroxythreonine-4-phosphate dehydrogenase PdxA [Methylobacterium sp.]